MSDNTYIQNTRTAEWEKLSAKLTTAYKEMEPAIVALENIPGKFSHGNQGVAHQFVDVAPNVLQLFMMMAEEYQPANMKELEQKLLRYANVSEALQQHVQKLTPPALSEDAKSTLLGQLKSFDEGMVGLVQEMNLSENAAAPTVDNVTLVSALAQRGATAAKT